MEANRINWAFPVVEPGEYPVGPRVLVQLETVRAFSEGGIALPETTREANKSLTQIGKIIAMGTIAFCNRETGKPWPEGIWAKVGDLVRVPKYVGDRFERPVPGSKDKAVFMILEDHMVKSIIHPEFFHLASEVL